MKKLIIILVAVAIVIGFFGWKNFSNNKNKVQYQTAKVERGTLVVSVAASGQVLTTGRLPILSQASGQVKEVLVKNGDQVTAGQKILSITLDPVASQKNTAAWSSLLVAQAKINSLQSALFKANQAFINDKGITNPTDAQKTDPKYVQENADWLQAEADYKNQTAAITAAWQSYQQTSPDLISPVAGTVTDLVYIPGMLVANPTVSIINSSPIAITVNLSEADVNKVNQDNKATVTFDALPGKTFTGKVAGINKTGVVTSGVTNFPATIQLDTAPPEILPNMSASANILVATKNNVLLVPSDAIQNKKIKILNQNKIKLVPVETGLSSDTQTEIISGVNEGEEIITGTAVNTPAATGTSPFSTFRLGGNPTRR